MLNLKANKSEVDKLKLQIAMAGGGSGEGSDVMDIFESMIADRARLTDLQYVRDMLSALATKNAPGGDEAGGVRGQERTWGSGDGGDFEGSEGMEGGGDGDRESSPSSGGPGSGVRGRFHSSLSTLANKSDMGQLVQQVGDLFNEVDRLNTITVKLSKAQEKFLKGVDGEKAAAALSMKAMEAAQLTANDLKAQEEFMKGLSGEKNAAALSMKAMKVAQLAAKDLKVLRDQMEEVAHGISLMSVGPQEVAVVSGIEQVEEAKGLNGDMSTTQHQHAVGVKDHVGSYERLVKMMAKGDIRRKSDYFNPEILAHLIKKVQSIDSLGNNSSSPVTGPDMGIREIESQLKKVIKEVKILRADRKANESNENMAAHGGWGKRAVAEGEHAMISGKPLLGFKCMACDRPLDKLDGTSGPYIPNQMMPTKGGEVQAGNKGGKPVLPDINDKGTGAQRKKPLMAFESSARRDGAGIPWNEDKGDPEYPTASGDVGPNLQK
eukprot:gene441-1839_t